MEVLDQLDTIVPELCDVARRVRPDQFENETPCDNFTVRDLMNHLIGGASTFASQLRGDDVAPVDPASIDDADRIATVEKTLADLLAATKSQGALGRTVALPFGEVPGSVLARFLTVDGMVHTWDLARATDQDYGPGEELAENVLASARDLIAPAMRDGDTFKAETPVAPDAPAVVRLVAFTGRTV